MNVSGLISLSTFGLDTNVTSLKYPLSTPLLHAHRPLW